MRAKKFKQEGNKLFAAQQFDEAIAKYKEALAVCPLFHIDRVVYLSNMGLCYLRKKDYANAFRTAQNGLAIRYDNVKLINTHLTALKELLPCADSEGDDAEQKDDAFIHSESIAIGANNQKCRNRRLYDVLMYQALWDCELHYTHKAVDPRSSQEVTDQFRENDPLMKRLKKITSTIENYLTLNFEEFQYFEHIKRVEAVYGDLEDDILKLANEQKLSVKQMLETIRADEESPHNCTIRASMLNEESVLLIVPKSADLAIDKESNIVVAINEEVENNEAESDVKTKTWINLRFCSDWNANDVDIVHASFYGWENVKPYV